jgi:hypothetical protein
MLLVYHWVYFHNSAGLVSKSLGCIRILLAISTRTGLIRSVELWAKLVPHLIPHLTELLVIHLLKFANLPKNSD